jgi:hypothetical protein
MDCDTARLWGVSQAEHLPLAGIHPPELLRLRLAYYAERRESVDVIRA